MSRLPFELLLALRYLRPKRTFVSIITLISVLGVTLGVAVLIIVISVMSGFDKEMREKVLGFNAHLHVSPREGTLANYEQLSTVIRSNAHVTGVAPIVLGQVLIETKSRDGHSANVAAPWARGVDVDAEKHVSTMHTNLVDGTYDLSGRGIVLGAELANRLAAFPGDRVTVYSPHDIKEIKAAREKGEESFRTPDDYEVRGVFDSGWYEYNANFALVSLENAQRLYDLGASVHGLSVAVDDPLRAEHYAAALSQQLGFETRVTSWMQENPTMVAVMVEKNVMLYILFFIVLVAAFGITCTTITFVVMKTSDVGLMKALGATNRQVMSVFLAQSLVVSFFGILCGTGAGLLAIHYRNEFLALMRKLTGFELFPASVYGFNQLPALVIPSDLAIICGGSLIICLLAAVLPARHASKLRPVEALRHE
ncbi:MAG: hypothetical protein RLY20_1004 [Verrucomicrobiota bacterium]|jgi:lipoprotein-releasing system permease protein